ncbi:hypothetical protein [Caballeronia sp. GACF4]|uniref:hypothetical protein n=1 Tax=Caballeronia sp. GACF4 TaxID=2921763 RepID=UPI00202869F2|nr:hypothetical protein [Caballeronia sp. GACF4]
MSITCNFTPRNTLRIECGGEIIEVVLPTSSTTAPPEPDSAKPEVVMRPISRRVLPKPCPGIMAIVAGKKSEALDFDWMHVHDSVHLHSLESIERMNGDQFAQSFGPGGSGLEVSDNGLRMINVGVAPWSGTTPSQLENLRQIVEDHTNGVDAVRLFKLPDAG